VSIITLIIGVIIGFIIGMIVAAGSWRKALGKLGAYATNAANDPAPAVNHPTSTAIHAAPKTDIS
jgi:hypothetical protein